MPGAIHGESMGFHEFFFMKSQPRPLKQTASLPLKIDVFPKKEAGSSSNHPFSGAFTVSFREGDMEPETSSRFKKGHLPRLHFMIFWVQSVIFV